MPKQFKTYDGLDNLIDTIFPERFQKLGYTLCGDNFFFTLPQIIKLVHKNTATIATMRKNRIERFLTSEQFVEMTKKPKKKDFKRKILILDTMISRTKIIQLQSYFDKETCNPVIFAISDPHLISDKYFW